MAVAPDFHADFLTIERNRRSLPTAPSSKAESFCAHCRYFTTIRPPCQGKRSNLHEKEGSRDLPTSPNVQNMIKYFSTRNWDLSTFAARSAAVLHGGSVMQEDRFAQQICGLQTAKGLLGAVATQLLKSKFKLTA